MYALVKDALKGLLKLSELKKKNNDKKIREKAIDYFRHNPTSCMTKDFYKQIYKDDKDYINRITEINKVLLDLEMQEILHNIKYDGSTIETRMWRYIGTQD
ncbi:MAG TPA: hypothetical protein GX727_01535 [Clostridium sp.]|nr:hypothetical protein [Clostridium sp.]